MQADLADLVLEQVAERFDDLPEIDKIRQTSHIVVGFDDGGFTAQSGLYHIRVDRSLNKIIYGADLMRDFFKYTDELFAYDLALAFRLLHTCKADIETVLRVDPDEIQVIGTIRPEHALDQIPFILAQKTVIYKYAGKVFPDSP